MKTQEEIKEKFKELEEKVEKRYDARFDYILLKLTKVTGTMEGIKREVMNCEYATEEFKRAYIKGLKKAEELIDEQIEEARKDIYCGMYMEYRDEYRKLTKEDQPEEDYEDYDDYDEDY